jgi:phage shock protein A
LADAISRGTKTKAALQFLEEMRTTRDELQTSLAELEPQLQSLAARATETSAALADKREKLEKRRLDLEDQDHLKKAEVTRLGDEVERMRQDFRDLELLVPGRRLGLCQLTENDLSTMRLHADSPPQKYTSFFEFLSVLLGGPPQWMPNGRALVYDPLLTSTLASGVNPPNVSIDTLARARHVVMHATFARDSLEAIAPALGTIFDWAMTVYNYCQMREKIKTREADLKAKEDDYNRFVESTKSNREEIADLGAELDSQVHTLNTSAQEKELLEKKFSLLNSEFRMVGSILKGSNSLEEQWYSSLTQFDTEKQLIVTYAAVMATYLVCCGMMNYDERNGFVQALGYDVSASDLAAINDNLFVFVGSMLALLCNVPIPLGLGEELERDLRHIYCAQRPPLVMDNDGLLTNVLLKDAKMFSMLSNNLDALIAAAIKEEKSILLLDVNELNPKLEKLLANPPKTSLILLTSLKRIEDISDQLLSRVCLIQVEARSHVRELFSSAFVSFFDPEMLPRLASTQSVETRYHVEVDRFARDTLKLIAAAAGQSISQLMEEEETIANMLKAKECYFAALSVSGDFQAITGCSTEG